MTKLSRIYESIVLRIESGRLREGDRLPSEEQLAASHQVSLGTVRHALARLAHAGLISREHGRGTFVSGAKLAPAEVRYLRFQNGAGRELPQYVKVLSVRRIKRKGIWSTFLDGEAFVRIERLLNAGGRCDLYSEFWLQEGDYAQLDGVDRGALSKNLREMLGQQLALPTMRVDQLIRFESPTVSAARNLGIAEDAPCFVMEVRGYTLRERPLYWHRIFAGPFSDSLIIVR